MSVSNVTSLYDYSLRMGGGGKKFDMLVGTSGTYGSSGRQVGHVGMLVREVSQVGGQASRSGKWVSRSGSLFRLVGQVGTTF